METSQGGSFLTTEERSLLVMVLDVSPAAWGERDLARSANDKARLSHNKRSVGPATLDDLLKATETFGSAFHCLQRESVLIIVGVAGNKVDVLHPRKDELQSLFELREGGEVAATRSRRQDVVLGVAELVQRASEQASAAFRNSKDIVKTSASIAAGISTALCLVNRFFVAAGMGVSALQTASHWHRSEDSGLLPILGDPSSSKTTSHKKATSWSPRILVVQVSEDRSRDYNAIMNCTFCAIKYQVVIDGCFLPLGSKTSPSSSPYLEQVCDRTSGLFLAPSGAAQVSGALTEVLLSVFLADPRSCRPLLHLPALHKVDFRARCFETGKSVDMAHVCNQCLSIFEDVPKYECPTCGAQPKIEPIIGSIL